MYSYYYIMITYTSISTTVSVNDFMLFWCQGVIQVCCSCCYVSYGYIVYATVRSCYSMLSIVCIYIYIYTHVYIYIYIYIHV